LSCLPAPFRSGTKSPLHLCGSDRLSLALGYSLVTDATVRSPSGLLYYKLLRFHSDLSRCPPFRLWARTKDIRIQIAGTLCSGQEKAPHVLARPPNFQRREYLIGELLRSSLAPNIFLAKSSNYNVHSGGVSHQDLPAEISEIISHTQADNFPTPHETKKNWHMFRNSYRLSPEREWSTNQKIYMISYLSIVYNRRKPRMLAEGTDVKCHDRVIWTVGHLWTATAILLL
jgi:hypothetical protein